MDLIAFQPTILQNFCGFFDVKFYKARKGLHDIYDITNERFRFVGFIDLKDDSILFFHGILVQDSLVKFGSFDQDFKLTKDCIVFRNQTIY